MTTISATRMPTGVTPFERTLLATASSLDAFVLSRVATRLARRGDAAQRRIAAAQASAVSARRAAQARGALGIMPR